MALQRVCGFWRHRVGHKSQCLSVSPIPVRLGSEWLNAGVTTSMFVLFLLLFSTERFSSCLCDEDTVRLQQETPMICFIFPIRTWISGISTWIPCLWADITHVPSEILPSNVLVKVSICPLALSLSLNLDLDPTLNSLVN